MSDEVPENWTMEAPVFGDNTDAHLWKRSGGQLKGYAVLTRDKFTTEVTAWDRTVNKYLHVHCHDLSASHPDMWHTTIKVDPNKLDDFDHFRPIIENIGMVEGMPLECVLATLESHGYKSWRKLWEHHDALERNKGVD